jgi:hypothetical protein
VLAKLVPMLMAAAVALLLFALARMGEALKQLRRRIETLEKPPEPPEPAVSHPPGFHGLRRPMLGAIMEERTSMLDDLGRWPGGRLALWAGALALVASLASLAAGGPKPDPTMMNDVAQVRQRLDSVTSLIARLKDSVPPTVLAVATPPAAEPKPAPAKATQAKAVSPTRVSRQAPARPGRPAERKAATTLPPAPSLTGTIPAVAPAKVDSIH